MDIDNTSSVQGFNNHSVLENHSSNKQESTGNISNECSLQDYLPSSSTMLKVAGVAGLALVAVAVFSGFGIVGSATTRSDIALVNDNVYECYSDSRIWSTQAKHLRDPDQCVNKSFFQKGMGVLEKVNTGCQSILNQFIFNLGDKSRSLVLGELEKCQELANKAKNIFPDEWSSAKNIFPDEWSSAKIVKLQIEEIPIPKNCWFWGLLC